MLAAAQALPGPASGRRVRAARAGARGRPARRSRRALRRRTRRLARPGADGRRRPDRRRPCRCSPAWERGRGWRSSRWPARPPGRPPPEMRLEGEISVRRRAPRPEPPPEPEPEAGRGREAPSPSRSPSARSGEGPAPLVETARLELTAARQPQAHALALGHVADLGQLRAGIVHRLDGRVEVLARDGDQQLEVLPARRRQLDRGLALRPRPRPLRPPPARGRGRSRCGSRSRSARWPASAPRPSLMSIIAVAPALASARPSRSLGVGSSWRSSSPLPRSAGSPRRSPASISSTAAAAPPSSPVTATTSRGLAPPRVTKRAPPGS